MGGVGEFAANAFEVGENAVAAFALNRANGGFKLALIGLDGLGRDQPGDAAGAFTGAIGAGLVADFGVPATIV